MVLLAEHPSIVQLIGVAMVVGGIALATVPLARVRDVLRRNRADQPSAGPPAAWG